MLLWLYINIIQDNNSKIILEFLKKYPLTYLIDFNPLILQ